MSDPEVYNPYEDEILIAKAAKSFQRTINSKIPEVRSAIDSGLVSRGMVAYLAIEVAAQDQDKKIPADSRLNLGQLIQELPNKK